MRIATKAFAGMQPRLEPHLLPDGAAADAVDVVLDRGSIAPLKAPAYVADLEKTGPILSIYRFGKDLDDDTRFWFHWTADTDVARGPIPDDTSERTYYTEAGQPPKVTDATMATTDGLMPSASYLLGIPTPETIALVTVTPAPEDEGDDEQESTDTAELERQECRLAYTFVSAWGEEGVPTVVSEPFNAGTGDTLNVSNMDGPPTGAHNITHKRLYVAVTDSTGVAVLRFWQEITVGQAAYSAEFDMTVLGEALPEFSLVPPPADLFGLMDHPGGFMIGFSGKRVCHSEPLKPYGWPHFSPVAYDIVGGAILGQATVICTKGDTYMATQADPVTFTPVRLDGAQPCVAKRTIRAFKGGVLYASPDGLVLVDAGGTLSVATEAIMTRAQWQVYRPESMHAAVHDNRYFCWFDNGSEQGCLILEIAAGGVTLTRSRQYATAAYADPRRDELFAALADGKVHKWNAGAPIEFQYVSKTFLAERPQNLGAVQVIADAYPVEFELQAVIEADDGPRTVTTSKTISSGRPGRLDGSYRAREYRYCVKARATVKEVTVASTLANVTAV